MRKEPNLIYVRISEIDETLLKARKQLTELRDLLATIVDLPDEWRDELPRERVTGWRFVRGTHSGTYVEDPKGVDRLPLGYDFTEHAHPGDARTRRERKRLRLKKTP